MEVNNMQAKNGSIIITVIICAVLLGGLMIYSQPSAPATAAEIAALVVIPEIPAQVDNSAEIAEILDAVGWDSDDIKRRDRVRAENLAADEIDEEDFKELLADLLDIDEDDFNIVDLDVKDTEVTATSEDAYDNGDVTVEGFLRIEYRDVDESDNDVVYVVVTADITDLKDEDNDQDVDYSMREVTRNFDFD